MNNSEQNNSMTIAEAFASLDELLKKMESGRCSLEESFALYQQGLELIKLCTGKIDRIEKQLQTLSENTGEVSQ